MGSLTSQNQTRTKTDLELVLQLALDLTWPSVLTQSPKHVDCGAYWHTRCACPSAQRDSDTWALDLTFVLAHVRMTRTVSSYRIAVLIAEASGLALTGRTHSLWMLSKRERIKPFDRRDRFQLDRELTTLTH